MRDNFAISKVLSAVARAETPRQAADALLRGCVELSGSDRGRLYFFHLATAEFRVYTELGRRRAGSSISHPSHDAVLTELAPIERAILSGIPQVVNREEVLAGSEDIGGEFHSRAVMPVMRESTCIGVVDLESDTPNNYKARFDSQGLVSLIVSLCRFIYDWRSRRKLLEEIQQVVDFAQPEGSFYEELMSLVALASQMEFIALRELSTDGTLDCIASFGFGDTENSDLDLLAPYQVEPFGRVLKDKHPYSSRTLEGDEYSYLREMHALRDVRSFVACPVLVGDKLFGVLSFASSAEYEYTQDEILGFSSLANGAGVSITNYRNFHATMMSVTAYSEIGTAIMAMEVATAARHEARGVIDDATAAIVVLKRQIASKAAKVKAELMDTVDEIDESLDLISEILDKIKAATKAPAEVREKVTISAMWEQAKNQVLGRLIASGVTNVKYDGPSELVVEVAPDWFRQVFINLLLNSADAFVANNSNRRNRTIRLIVERPSEKQKDIEMVYIDNAGGINFTALRSLDGKPITADLRQAVFAPNITSKPEGSGWGLALVRKIMRDHDGSVDLGEQRSGASFRLTMPKAL